MKATNGTAHSLNGHSQNGHGLTGHSQNGHSQNGHHSYGMNRIAAKTDAIISWIQDNEGKLSLFACGLLALLLYGGVSCGFIRVQPTPDPYSAIKTQIDNIDLDRPKHDIRLELDQIESAVEDLRPEEEPDGPTMFGT
jgi:hypothetical protein